MLRQIFQLNIMKKILLIEDSLDYARIAKKYIASKNFAVSHARDYSEAISQLGTSNYNGAMIDCFFPEKTGSNSIAQGIELVNRIIGPTPPKTTFNDGSNIFAPPGKFTTLDYNALLMEAMKRDESNQPLGIAIAEIAKKIGLPYIMATSTFHHDNLTQPFINQGWGMYDCDPSLGESKLDLKFWERAFGGLEEKMRNKI